VRGGIRLLDKLDVALNATGIPFREGGWDRAPKGDYGVYTLDSAAGSVWADGKMREQALEGTIDLFSKSGGVANLNLIQQAINSIDGLSWYLNSIQYENDTRLMHYEWVFSFALEVS